MDLLDHEKAALKQTKDFRRVAYYMDMGLGKTYVGAEKMMQLGCVTNLLICQKSKIEDWMQHFKDNYRCKLYDLTKRPQMDDFLVNDTAWNGYLGGTEAVGIINYELAWRRPELLDLRHFTLMLDESSNIQNECAKQSKCILKMQPENVILLSGTPTAGKYERLWSQVHLLGWGITKELYYSQYIVTDWLEDRGSGFRTKIVKGYKNVDRLKEKLSAHGALFMKTEDVYDLPKQQHISITVAKTAEYRKFMKNRIITLKDPHVQLIGDTALTKRLYARQLCGQYNRAKLDAFKDLIDSTEDRVIVFYNFTAELEELQKAAGDRPQSVVNGNMKDLSAYGNDPSSITFIQYQAGAMGLNLQKANKVIYFTLPERSELFEQSKKRIHRIGQDKPCLYYYLLCRDSVEQHILETLKQRKDYTDALFEKYDS